MGEIPLKPGKIDPASLKEMPPSPQESSQAGMANDMAHTSCSPSVSPMPGTSEATSVPSASHSWASSRANSITLPDEVLHLQEEMNNAMSHLLTTWDSLDAHWQMLISDTKTALHQNEVNATDTIKEVKTHCLGSICEAEALQAVAIREAEATCSISIMKQRVPMWLQLGKQKLLVWHMLLTYNRHKGKPCWSWKVRPSRRKGGLTNPSCGPTEWPSRPVLWRL